jgi:micrococcal nuclease
MKSKILLFILIAVLIAISASAVYFFINNSEDVTNPDMIANTVVNVIDGDTFEMYSSGEDIETIRLLCVNTPEKNEEGYEDAKLYLKSLISGKQVILNSSITDKDIYNRLLRYVYVNDSGNLLFVNKLILDNNYGELMIIPPEECREVK